MLKKIIYALLCGAALHAQQIINGDRTVTAGNIDYSSATSVIPYPQLHGDQAGACTKNRVSVQNQDNGKVFTCVGGTWVQASGSGGGTPGQGYTWRGAWLNNIAYAAYDTVSYQGSSYVAILSNTGVIPSSDLTKWNVVAGQGSTGATGATGPTGPAGPGSSATQLSAMLDFKLLIATTTTTNDTVQFNMNNTPTVTSSVDLNGSPVPFSGPGSCKLSSVTGAGTFYYYFDGVHLVCGGPSTATITPTGTNVTTATVTAYPAGVRALGRWTFTGNAFDTTTGAYTDDRSLFNATNLTCSAFLVCPTGFNPQLDTSRLNDPAAVTLIGASTAYTCKVSAGTVAPGGVVTGSPCDQYYNTAGGTGAVMYIKETGSATTSGWAAVTTH